MWDWAGDGGEGHPLVRGEGQIGGTTEQEVVSLVNNVTR